MMREFRRHIGGEFGTEVHHPNELGRQTRNQESGMYLVERRNVLLNEERRFYNEEVRETAALTDRFDDLRRGEPFPYVGGTLLDHTIKLTRQVALWVPRENERLLRVGQPLLQESDALFDAKYEDLHEVIPGHPEPDVATNAKSPGYRQLALERLHAMVERTDSEALHFKLLTRIELIVQKVDPSLLPRETRFVKLLEDQQHALGNALHPFIDWEQGNQQLQLQPELFKDITWHVLERLLRDGQEFPTVLEPIYQHRQDFIRLITQHLLDEAIVRDFCRTLTTVNPNRRYPPPEEMVARMRDVREQLRTMHDPSLPSAPIVVPEGRLIQIA